MENLTDLFETDLGDCPLAAVRDDFTTDKFLISGVMLINNKYWREHDIFPLNCFEGGRSIP